MADVDEIIDYIKALKKGFDKDLFQNKISELAYAVDTTGLDYKDFHVLVKVWLNLCIPITKWVTLGASLVPQDCIKEVTIKYALSWILSNYHNQSFFSRICFVLDWFTAAMECEFIDMDQLDLGYEVFYACLTYETLTPHAIKLVYTLTKPCDVTRSRVVELLNYAKIREGKKNMCRQLQVLLGLFKSYRPECVPEDVPAISIHTAFKKIDANLLERFKRNQKRGTNLAIDRCHWICPDFRRNTKADSLVPNMEYVVIGSRQHINKEQQKTFLDYTDAASVLHCGTERWSSRPARLRALLCNETGVALLALAPQPYQAFLSHDLHHLLNTCFLETSSHSYTEKQDLLSRLAMLQRTLMQGIPVITRFLAQYILLWNEKEYFAEIMELVQWVSVDSPDHVMSIVEPLTRIYHRAQPIEQCAILASLNIMYSNLMYCSTRSRYHFMDPVIENKYEAVLPEVATAITCMCTKGLQVNPGDVLILHSVVSSAVHRARNSMRYSAVGGLERVSPLTLALPLVSVSAMLMDKVASFMILYRRLLSLLKTINKVEREDELYCEQMQLLQAYTEDLTNCLYCEEVFSARKNGFVFAKLHPQLVGKLLSLMPNADSMFSIKNNIAFWTDTYFELDENELLVADNKSLFKSAIDPMFMNLSKLLKNIVRELRS